MTVQRLKKVEKTDDKVEKLEKQLKEAEENLALLSDTAGKESKFHQ